MKRKELVQFEISNVEEYLRNGDYTSFHEFWMKQNGKQLSYEEYLTLVLVPEWEECQAFGYSNGTIYGVENGYNVNLDDHNFDESDWVDICTWDCIRIIE